MASFVKIAAYAKRVKYTFRKVHCFLPNSGSGALWLCLIYPIMTFSKDVRQN